MQLFYILSILIPFILVKGIQSSLPGSSETQPSVTHKPDPTITTKYSDGIWKKGFCSEKKKPCIPKCCDDFHTFQFADPIKGTYAVNKSVECTFVEDKSAVDEFSNFMKYKMSADKGSYKIVLSTQTQKRCKELIGWNENDDYYNIDFESGNLLILILKEQTNLKIDVSEYCFEYDTAKENFVPYICKEKVIVTNGQTTIKMESFMTNPLLCLLMSFWLSRLL